MENSFRARGGQLEAVCVCMCVCDNRVCGSFGRGESPWMYVQPPLPLLPILPLLLLLSDSLLSFPQPTWQQNEIIINEFDTIINLKIKNKVIVTGLYPFEVVHVGGLYWSAYKRQVVDFCCLLISLVRLDKQLTRKKQGRNTINEQAEPVKPVLSSYQAY